MAATTVTNVAGSIPIKWRMEMLKTADGYLVADKFANTEVESEPTGNTVRINRVLRPAKQTTASTAGTLITASDATNLLTNYIDLTPEIWGESFGFNEDVSLQSILSSKHIRESVSNHMARSLDYQIMKKMSTQGFRYRNDGDTTYYSNGAVHAGGSTTTTQISELTEADDFWNGGFLTITNPAGPAYDQTVKVSDFATSGDLLTHAAFTTIATTASRGSVTVGTGIVATDKLVVGNLIKMAAFHEKFQTEKFDGGTIRSFISPDQKADLWTDTGFTDSATYDDSGRFRNYTIVRWMGIEFMISSETYREDVDGTENQATGIVYVAPFFGKNSYSVIRFGNKGAGSKFGVEFIPVEEADSGNLRKSAKYLSWKGNFAAKVTRATSCIGLMTGATDQGIIV